MASTCHHHRGNWSLQVSGAASSTAHPAASTMEEEEEEAATGTATQQQQEQEEEQEQQPQEEQQEQMTSNDSGIGGSKHEPEEDGTTSSMDGDDTFIDPAPSPTPSEHHEQRQQSSSSSLAGVPVLVSDPAAAAAAEAEAEPASSIASAEELQQLPIMAGGPMTDTACRSTVGEEDTIDDENDQEGGSGRRSIPVDQVPTPPPSHPPVAQQAMAEQQAIAIAAAPMAAMAMAMATATPSEETKQPEQPVMSSEQQPDKESGQVAEQCKQQRQKQQPPKEQPPKQQKQEEAKEQPTVDELIVEYGSTSTETEEGEEEDENAEVEEVEVEVEEEVEKGRNDDSNTGAASASVSASAACAAAPTFKGEYKLMKDEVEEGAAEAVEQHPDVEHASSNGPMMIEEEEEEEEEEENDDHDDSAGGDGDDNIAAATYAAADNGEADANTDSSAAVDEGDNIDDDDATGGDDAAAHRAEMDDSDEPPVATEFELTFADYVDLQTRLILVPYNDGECLGAVVASYEANTSATAPSSSSSNGNGLNNDGDEINIDDSADNADDSSVMEEVELDDREEKKGDDDPQDALANVAEPPSLPENIVGSVLVRITGLGGEEDDDDWTQVDFTYILSSFREVDAPIVLRFRQPDERPAEVSTENGIDRAESSNEKLADAAGTSDSEIEQRAHQDHEEADSSAPTTTTTTTTTSALLSSRLSRWGSKVRSSTSHLAHEAKERGRRAMEEAERQLEKKGIADRIVGVAPSTSEDIGTSYDDESDNDESNASEGDEETREGSSHSDGDDAQQRAPEEKASDTITNSNAGVKAPPQPNDECETTEHAESLTPSPRTWEDAGLSQPPCGLFLQKSSGTFAQLDLDPEAAEVPSAPQVPTESSLSVPVSLRPSISSSSLASSGSKTRSIGDKSGALTWRKKLAPLHPVSNTSVLLVRASADTPCPAKGYQYQWYRSCKRIDDETRGRNGHHDAASDYDDDDIDEDGSCNVAAWYALTGATYAAFQPSATDIGHRIRCVITVDPSQSVAPEDEESNQSCYTVVCELPYPVVADSGLFNAARQSFAGPNGGVFANLKGRGNAEGRVFRLQVMPAEQGSRMRIFQTSGTTAEPIHSIQEPIMKASAISAPAQPKVFELIFPSGLPPSGVMVQALCDDDGRFLLRAPNRIARESFLLSLGIANYCGVGKPADLSIETTLFPDTPPGVEIQVDYHLRGMHEKEGEVISGGSREVQVVSPVDEEEGDESSISERRLSFLPLPSLSPKTPGAEVVGAEADARFQVLEDELRTKIEKLFAKEKTCADLQRRMAAAETAKKRSDEKIAALRSEAGTNKAKYKECHKALRSAEKKIEMHDSARARMRQEYEQRIATLESRIRNDEKESVEREKTIKSLQNEKAVLAAAVEARDGKLSKLEQLQETVESLKGKVAKGQSTQRELDTISAKFNTATIELDRAKASEKERCEEIQQLKNELESSQLKLKKEQKSAERCKAQMEGANMKCQKIKVERNTFKQKADSLAKDISRVCRNGMGVDEIESVMQEYETLKHEVSLLKTQKRRALEELDESRRLHEQSIKAQVKAGIDGEAVRALEQRNELERVVSELTEYVDAKEMQLRTLMDVNKALQEEIHTLAQTKMANDEV